MDNQRLIAYLLSKPGAGQPTVTRPGTEVLPQPDYATTYEDGTPISVYDGASVLCSLKEIDFVRLLLIYCAQISSKQMQIFSLN